jgi:phage-related tail fiber protein
MPGQQIQKGTTYVNYPAVGNSQVTAENLNDHVDNAVLLPGAISAQAESTPQASDYVLSERGGALFKYTLESIRTLFSAVFVQLTGGTMTGPLILNNSSPATSATAASKGYVDATAAAATLPGAIVMWGGSTPSGWLECNGQSTAGYANLTAIYGTNVPDLRGEFIRGWDHGKGVDPGRGIRSFQGQDIQPHTHMPPSGYQYVTTPFSGDGEIDGSGRAGEGERNASAVPSAVNAGAETRPRNVALMFIVKT